MDANVPRRLFEDHMERPPTYAWDVQSLNFGCDHAGPFLFFVDANGGQHRVDFNLRQVWLLLHQIANILAP